MIIVFIVRSMAVRLMNFPCHHFRGTAQKLILMRVKNCIAAQANSCFFIFQMRSMIVGSPSVPESALKHMDTI